MLCLYGDVLGFHPNLEGNVHNVWSPDILQVKKDVLKFLAAGSRLSGTNIDLQLRLQKETHGVMWCDGIYIINLKSTWKQLLLMAHAILAIEDVADISGTSSRNTGQGDRLKFATRTTLNVGCLASGTFTARCRQLPRSHIFWWLLIPGMTTSLSKTCLMLTCLHHST